MYSQMTRWTVTSVHATCAAWLSPLSTKSHDMPCASAFHIHTRHSNLFVSVVEAPFVFMLHVFAETTMDATLTNKPGSTLTTMELRENTTSNEKLSFSRAGRHGYHNTVLNKLPHNSTDSPGKPRPYIYRQTPTIQSKMRLSGYTRTYPRTILDSHNTNLSEPLEYQRRITMPHQYHTPRHITPQHADNKSGKKRMETFSVLFGVSLLIARAAR